jgi:hypothetical protein
MDCKKANELCLEYWELDQSRQGELESHFRVCPECGTEFKTYCNCLQIYREFAKAVTEEDNSFNYWNRLCKKLHRPSLSERLNQRLSGLLKWFNRSVWGPVPVYAVATVALVAFLAVLPLVQNGQSVATNRSSFRSNLVVERFEPMRANTQGSMTTYTFAQLSSPR